MAWGEKEYKRRNRASQSSDRITKGRTIGLVGENKSCREKLQVSIGATLVILLIVCRLPLF